jgi:oligosaccharide repeat unit polymerase
LFSDWGNGYEAITIPEYNRAVLYADIGLVVMSLVWIVLANNSRSFKQLRPSSQKPITQEKSVSARYIRIFAIFVIPLGIIGLMLTATLPGIGNNSQILGDFQRSNYFNILSTWSGLGLLALIYLYGFRKRFVIFMLLYLTLMVFQGYSRFRVLIPILLMAQIFLSRRGKNWPPILLSILLIIAGFGFLPLKSVGRLLQQGAPISEIVDKSSEIISDALTGNSEIQFLDQLASALTLVDRQGRFYYGSTYASLLTLPIPREWWPEKPGLADYLKDISTTGRPMASTGMITTIFGEAYINFGFIGILIIPFFAALFLGRFYMAATKRSYFSLWFFSYLLVAANLIQVYRDGLQSLVVFTFVHMMPLVILIAVHIIFPDPQAGFSIRSFPLPTKPAFSTIPRPTRIDYG